MVVGISSLDPWGTCLWGIAFAAVNLKQQLYFSHQLDAEQLPVGLHALSAILPFILISGSVYVVHLCVLQRLRAELESVASASEASGVRRLLSVLCDAQVQLGPDLCILGAGRNLGQLLTMSYGSHAARSLDGVAFSNYLVEADQPRFETFINYSMSLAEDWCSGLAVPSPAASLQVHMHDSAGVPFEAELFHTYLHDLKGQPAHFIGICEGSRRDHAVDAQNDIPPSRLTWPLSRSRSSSKSSSSSSSKQSVALPYPESIEVGFAALSEKLDVSSYSYCFSFSKSSGLPSLKKALPKDKRAMFLKWLQDAVNRGLNGGLVEASWKDFRAYLPVLDHVLADLTLTAVLPPAEDQDDLEVTAMATFHNIRPDTHAISRLPSVDEDQSQGPPVRKSVTT